MEQVLPLRRAGARGFRRIILGAIWCFCVVPGAAQEPLTLDHVMQAALTRATEMELARLRLGAAAGESLRAAGAFDPVVEASAGTARQVEQAGGIASPTIERNLTSYRVGLAKRLGWGPLIQPALTVTHSAANALVADPVAVAEVDLGIVMPLHRDRWGIVSRSAQLAANARYSAEGHALEHSAEGAVLQAVTTYWRYLSATRQLAVYEAARSRAERLVDETGALVARDERPPADLNHVAGNLATKRIAVLAAEQAVVVARRDLGLAMGLPAHETRRLGSPATPFAEPDEREGSLDLSRLTASALDNRSDLAAAGDRVRAEMVLADAARSQLRSRLDLALSIGYTGSETGDGFGRLFGPLYTQVPGMNLALELRYDLPIHSHRARGLLAAQNALYEQTQVVERDLARTITIDVDVAEQALRRASTTVGDAAEAVALHQATVESEKIKHQLGDATLFDVIHAEDALTNAQLGEVRARVEHATARAVLRYHTGTLVDFRDGNPAVSTDGLNSPPR
ncbi:MAG: TolC family protein [Gammaproteobacteria bacterium]|nr:TolC family protein [Gammaproteobacteria bacterium]